MYTMFANASNIPHFTLTLIPTWYEESTPWDVDATIMNDMINVTMLLPILIHQDSQAHRMCRGEEAPHNLVISKAMWPRLPFELLSFTFLIYSHYMGVLTLLVISPSFILYVAYTQADFTLEVKWSIELGETCLHQTPT